MLVLVLLALASFAGCVGDDEAPAQYRVQAENGVASRGWAYDGAGLAPAQASLAGEVRDAENTGALTATFTLDGARYEVVFDQFAQAEGREFMDGGVAFALDEHGDTGVADASIPRIHATLAAWGKAKVSRDGELVTSEPWNAHVMISRDTVRGTDGRIAKADGATPYDPNAPADARRIENDPQAILWIKHPQGETFQRPPANLTASLACQAPQCATAQELAIEEGAATLTLNVTLAGPDPTLPVGAVGQGRVALIDANGTELAGFDVAPGPGGPSVTAIDAVPLDDAVLPLSLTLTGSGVFSVTAEGSATYTDVPFIVLTWDEVTLT